MTRHTVAITVNGKRTRVRYSPPRVPAGERHAGLLPSRVQVPASVYQRRAKHRHAQTDSDV